jgi:hypothetical protein
MIFKSLPSFSFKSRGLLDIKSIFSRKNGLNKEVQFNRGARLDKGSGKNLTNIFEIY